MADILRSMLGPGRPEVDCDTCFRMLDEYVERELAVGDAAVVHPRLAAHLDGCPVCREELESLLGFLREDARRSD